MIGSEWTEGSASGSASRPHRPEDDHPEITRQWIRTALLAGRVAFEREMARERKALDREFDRFWRAQRPQRV